MKRGKPPQASNTILGVQTLNTYLHTAGSACADGGGCLEGFTPAGGNRSAEGASLSLVTDGQISKALQKSPQEKKRGRLFQRLKSGLTWHKTDRLRFLTLTTSAESEYPIGRSWNHLVTSIRSVSPFKLWLNGYLSAHQLKAYYRKRGKSPSASLEMQYLEIQTKEGNGVIHAALYGDFIPQAFIADLWEKIHGSSRVDIRSPSDVDARQLASYFLRQYLVDQDALVRYSWSQGWVYRGFCKAWSECWKSQGFVPGLSIWYWSMDHQTHWDRWDGHQTKLLPDWELRRIHAERQEKLERATIRKTP